MAKKGLSVWVEKLGKVELPVLATVIKELNELTGKDDTEVNHLAEVILRDANLTSHVLRIANSVRYNPSNFPINTISRAIVLLGFSGVRAICISVMMIDSLLRNQPKEHLLGTMAKSFHAAVQARNLLKETDEAAREEVFISALLYHVGDMAFWSCAGEAANDVEQLIAAGTPEKEAIEEITGTSFKAITRELAHQWSLGETLEQALYPPKEPNSKVAAVELGEAISQVSKDGWSSPEMLKVINRVCQYTGRSVQQVQKELIQNADEAASVALNFGAAKVCHLIPTSANSAHEQGIAAVTVPAKPKLLEGDPQLQLSILRELSGTIGELDLNTIFQMVTEGIHRGIGIERVAVAFVLGDQLKLKYVLGEGTERWREEFSFPLDPREDSLFNYAFANAKPLWLGQKGVQDLKHLYSPKIKKLIGIYPCFIASVKLGSRDVALFYADRWNLGGKLDEEQFAGFSHFMSQTSLGIQLVAERKNGR